jgi:hypothetical protein
VRFYRVRHGKAVCRRDFYCIVALPSSDNLSFRKGMTSGLLDRWATGGFGPMPNTFPANPSGPDGFHWSMYATLSPTVPPPPTLSISFNPPNPSIPATTPVGTVVAQVVVTWSNGSPFTGTLSFGSPYFADGGTFGFDGSRNVIVAQHMSSDANTMQNITVVATQ